MEYTIDTLLLGYRALRGNDRDYTVLLFKSICILAINIRLSKSSRWKLKIKGVRTDVSCPCNYVSNSHLGLLELSFLFLLVPFLL